MSPIEFFPVGKSETCSIAKDGTVSFPQRILDAIGWRAGDEIATSYIPIPLTLLLRVTNDGRPGFKLSYLARTGNKKTGGKLNLSAFVNNIMRHQVILPRTGIKPAYLASGAYQLALVLEEIHWQDAEFNVSGIQLVPEDMMGVYEILGTDQVVLRIGEGFLQSRLREHLKDDRLRQVGRRVRYLAVNKDDAVILEKVLLALHELDHSSLPPFNLMRS